MEHHGACIRKAAGNNPLGLTQMAVPGSPVPAQQPRLSEAWGITSCCSEIVAQPRPRRPWELLYPVASFLHQGPNPSLEKGTLLQVCPSLGTLLYPRCNFRVLFRVLELSLHLFSISSVLVRNSVPETSIPHCVASVS